MECADTERGAAGRLWYKYRIRMITWALIGLTLAAPVADNHRHAGGILGLVALCILLAGINAVGNRRIIRRAVFPIAAVWAVARALEVFGKWQHDVQLSHVAGLALSCSIVWAIFDHFRSAPQLRNPIAEAFICYLVIATAFSQLYWILGQLLDHPFNQPMPHVQNSVFLYFSLVTISGVGYGGIIPINPYLRIVAGLETITGIFFVAVVVARLVSSYRPTGRSDPPGNG
jgi:hypothetical protein